MKPSSRQGLIDYCLRRLGYPVLEINVDEDQIDDLVDDALQYFQERHFDGVERMYLKYKITQSDIDRAKANVTTSKTVGITTYNYLESTNYIEIPDSVIGIEGIFRFDDSTFSSGMFNIAYQIFLNDVYNFTSIELLNYSMVKEYLETIQFLISPQKKIRYSKRQNRLYIDMNWSSVPVNSYVVIDCYRILDPSNFPKVWNDSFLKLYLTSLIKKQWGQNMSKFSGVKLPGGVELNGRQMYEDAVNELSDIKQRMSNEYELPPLDLIG
jgi:hypothetical protein